MVVPVCVVLCVSCSYGARSHWNGCMVLHAVCCGEEAGARNRVFFRVKWLQPAMKATSSVRRLRLGSFGSFYVFCNNACSCVRSSMRFLKLRCQIALEWLHGVAWAVYCGEEAGARNLVFFRVKWLQPAMKGTSYVRRLRLGSFGSFYVFCNNACSCVRSSMRFLKLWCQIALEWLHDVAWALCWGGEEAGARNRVFFRVKWLQPAMKATSSVRRLRLRSFLLRIVPPICVLQRVVAPVCVVLCVS